MKSRWLKRLVIGSIFMILVMVLCACDKEDVDYVDDKGNYNAAIQDSILGQQLQVPYACYQELNADVSGVKSIIIDDIDIRIPSGDRMDIVYCETADYENGFIERFLKGFSNDGAAVRYKPPNVNTVEDLNKTIEIHETWLEGAKAAGNSEGIAEMEKDIKFLNTLFEKTVDEYPIAKSIEEGEPYIVENGNSRYSTQTSHLGESEYLYVCLMRRPIHLKREYTGDEEHVGYGSEEADFSGIGRDSNMCKLTVEEASNKADAIMAKCGLNDMTLIDTGDIMWFYSIATGYLTGEELPPLYDGYVFQYVRSVNGEALYSPSLYSMDNGVGNIDGDIYGDIDAAFDQILLYIDDIGVVRMEGTYRLSETGRDKNVSLLTFEEAIAALNEGIADYYKKYPTSYSKICFNDVRLTYYAVSDGKGDFKIIPVWVFSEDLEYENEGKTEIDENTPVQLVIVNAVDGTIVDIPQELGMFFNE